MDAFPGRVAEAFRLPEPADEHLAFLHDRAGLQLRHCIFFRKIFPEGSVEYNDFYFFMMYSH